MRGDEKPPTAWAIWRQGADGGDGTPMGRERTAEPPDTIDPAEEDDSKGPRPAQSDDADGARSEHGALVRRKYERLVS